MNRKIFLLLSVIFVLFACNETEKNSKNSDNQSTTEISTSLFSAQIENTAFEAKTKFVEKNDVNAIITAIDENYTKILISLPGTDKGNYKLDSTSFVSNDNGPFYITEGSLTIDKSANNLISGNFSFTAKAFDGQIIKVENGKFADLPLMQTNAVPNKLTTSQYTIVDVTNGTIKTENTSVEITISGKSVVFSDKKDIQNSFSIQFDKIDTLSNAVNIKAQGGKYESIYIDNLNKTVTVFYTNGNSVTYK